LISLPSVLQIGVVDVCEGICGFPYQMLSRGWFSKESFDFCTKCFPEDGLVQSLSFDLLTKCLPDVRTVVKESVDFLTKCFPEDGLVRNPLISLPNASQSIVLYGVPGFPYQMLSRGLFLRNLRISLPNAIHRVVW